MSLNGSAKINVTGETLVKLQAHRKNYAQPGRYVISFGDATLRTKIGVRQTDLVTLAGEIWFVYITLKSKPAGTTPPSIRARAHVLPAQSVRYYMPRIYELTWFASATGRTPFDFSERSPALNLKRLHLLDKSIDRVRILRDNFGSAAFGLLTGNSDLVTVTIGESGAQLGGTIPAIAAMFIGLFDTVRKEKG